MRGSGDERHNAPDVSDGVPDAAAASKQSRLYTKHFAIKPLSHAGKLHYLWDRGAVSGGVGEIFWTRVS